MLWRNAVENIEVVDYSDKLIIPGMIDCHVHYPQIDIIASYGEQLLDWLNRYAFPVEQKFADAEYAAEVAEFFVDELFLDRKGVWHMPMIALEDGQEFLIVDRGADVDNCDEHYFSDPVTLLAE